MSIDSALFPGHVKFGRRQRKSKHRTIGNLLKALEKGGKSAPILRQLPNRRQSRSAEYVLPESCLTVAAFVHQPAIFRCGAASVFAWAESYVPFGDLTTPFETC